MREMMNFKKYLTYMLILSALLGGITEAKTPKTRTVKPAENSVTLTPYQQEVKKQVMSVETYQRLLPNIRDNLDFSKSVINTSSKERDWVFIPTSTDENLGVLFSVYKIPSERAYNKSFEAVYKGPEYILPQYPQNEDYKKLSEKRFQIPSSAEKGLTPEQFEEVITIMRIVKKDIDFLMNEPFYDINISDYKAGKYTGKLYAGRSPYKKSEYASYTDFTSYFKERENPIEFEINNKLGRFLSLREISEFDNQIRCFGVCGGNASRPNYSSKGGLLMNGVGAAISMNEFGDEVSLSVFLIKRYGLYDTHKNFIDLIAGIGEIIKERGVDPENLPNIKNPDVQMYDKCLTYIYTQAKEVHDIVMESNLLPKVEKEEYNKTTKSIDGTLADYVSIDSKSPGLIKQDKIKITKAKNKIQRRLGRQK